MTNTLKKHGGQVKISSNVKKILIREGAAYGVELEGGEQFFAKNIISNADPSITYLDLVGRENISKKLAKRLDKTKYSVTSLILFLTLDIDVTKAGIDSGNFWIFRDAEVDDIFKELTDMDLAEGDEFPAMFMSCTTLKDPVSYNGRYHNFEIVTYTDYDNVPDFKGEKDYHSPEYAVFKEKVIAKFMNTVERLIPGAKGAVVQVELGTPKTNEFYINSTKGNVYGTEKTISNMGPFAFKNKTEIKNLYLCGSSTLSHGVAGATYSGVEAAARILQCEKNDLIKADETQELRVYDAENEATWPDWVHRKREDKVRHFKEIIPQDNV